MKVIIQIPCYNEEKTLPLVFEEMPKSIPGVDVLEYQIIDDGSSDKTVEVARELGVHHIVSSTGKNRRWLGRAFRLGVDNALRNNADIVVNTDGDNQYPSNQIPDLIKPILEKKADIVIGDRQPFHIKEFSLLKRLLQRLGSNIAQLLSGGEVKDAVSGFRAYSRKSLLKLNIITNYTYTVDTLMQAHKKGLDIVWVTIPTNKRTRESRLIKSISSKVRKSGLTMLRMFSVHEPFRIFSFLSFLFFLPATILIARFLFHYLFSGAEYVGLIQSLVIGTALLVVGGQLFVLGIVGDLIWVNRNLIEDALYRIKGLEYKEKKSEDQKED